MKPGYANLLQNTSKWRSALFVDETRLRQLGANHCQVAVSFLVDETGVRQSSANNRQVAVSFIGR
jgi:hypothetical protein